MPLIRIDAIKGRSKPEIKSLLDAAHQAMLTAFQVPERDRYQIYHEHAATSMICLDTGLDIPRTKKLIVVTVISRPRTQEMKQAFYRELCHELKSRCSIESSDVIVSIITNSDADWSFGLGRPQFLVGDLA